MCYTCITAWFVHAVFFWFAYSFLFYIYRVYLFFVYMMIIVLFVFVCIFVLLFPLFFPGHYASELMISFLPYIITVSGISAGISFFSFKKRMKSGYNFPAYRYFRGVSFLIFSFLFFWYSKQFNHFYIQTPLIQEQNTWTLKVLFANIHKDNTNYDAIKNIISTNEPDVLMFVEFADHHYDHLKTFLQGKYPYINHITRSKKFVGNMVFSKYPLDNKADDFPQWMRRYGYFSIPYKNQQIYFYLVHTSSPDTYDHFIMRNNQLTTFVNDFQNHESDRKHDNIIVVWDFNITPWSAYYNILDTVFSGKLINITKNTPFLFTRKLKELPLFLAHIDHLWTTPSFIIPTFTPVTLPGSDHKAFLFTLQLK